MSTTLSWPEITIRLMLTILAAALIGVNRSEHGRPAGLRTTLLVCLAASLSMIQTNLLLGTAGKAADSFVTVDVMRLPLGILSGMGFIGGGVILKRDNLVLGVTTAATLWYVTVMGLCFGGGQLALGSAALAIGLIVLWLLKWLELHIPRDRQATLVLTIGPDGPTENEVRGMILTRHYRILSTGMTYDSAQQSRELTCELVWRALADQTEQPEFVTELAQSSGVARLKWAPQGLHFGLDS
jgi:putative Mg2+ transporter-C (MgtC) family protein